MLSTLWDRDGDRDTQQCHRGGLGAAVESWNAPSPCAHPATGSSQISVGSRASSSSVRARGSPRGPWLLPSSPQCSPHSPPMVSRPQRQRRQRWDSLLALAGSGLSFSPVLQPKWGLWVHPSPPTPPVPPPAPPIPVHGADGGGELLLQPQQEALNQLVDAELLPALWEQQEGQGSPEGPVAALGTHSMGSPPGDIPTLVKRGGTVTVGTLKKRL